MPEAGFKYSRNLWEVILSPAGGPLFDTEAAATAYAALVEARGLSATVIKIPLWTIEGAPNEHS